MKDDDDIVTAMMKLLGAALFALFVIQVVFK